MAQSPEYPELLFVPPKAWGSGRDGKSVQYCVIHYTAGAERNDSAEAGALYDARRTDGTSTHFFCDPDSTVQCVLTRDRANACFHKGNRLGVQFELCGTQQTREQWLDPASLGVLDQAAKWVATVCLAYGLPIRKLTPSEVRDSWYSWPNGPKGICGHADVTLAYPEDGGSHMDPGQAFVWDVFLPMVENYATGGAMADSQLVVNGMYRLDSISRGADEVPAGGGNDIVGEQNWLVAQVKEIRKKLDALALGGIDVDALVAATVLAMKTDPQFRALLVDTSTEGANKAEDT